MSTTSMSSTPSTPPPPAPGGGGGPTGGAPAPATEPEGTSPSNQRSVVALLVAAGLVAVVIALVLVFGIARPPALATLAEEPEPALTASLAWSQWEEGGACLYVVAPSGEARQVDCGYDGEELVAWTDDGIAMLVWGPRDGLELIDPDTGEVVDTVRGESEAWFDREGGVVRTRTVDGTLTVTLRDSGVELWRVDAPENYGVNDGFLSPDGAWVVLVDGAGRLLLVPADGSSEPRIWHEVDQAWVRPVWEGTALPTEVAER
jgi:hypothetical protein